MISLKNGLVLGVLASLAAVKPAQAAVFTVTWEGTLDYGIYYANASDPGTDLTGRTFQVVYTIDASKGLDGSSPPYLASVYGGSGHGVGSSPVSAVFTIDGVGSYSIAGDYQSYAGRYNYDPGASPDQDGQYALDLHHDYSSDDVGNYLWQDYHQRYVYSSASETDPDQYGTLFDSTALDAPPARAFLPSDVRVTQFYYYDFHYDYTTQSYDHYRYLWAYSSNGAWVSPSAVPEPASWALLITGLGAVGAQLRRRRTRTQVSFV